LLERYRYLKVGMKPKLVSLALVSLWICFPAAASELGGVVKEKTKSVLSVIDKPCTVAPVQGALLNIDAPPVAVRTAALKLTLHEPVAKMPELTIEGKVKPPAKQTEME
jgi:iron complex outermembrane receptor protein